MDVLESQELESLLIAIDESVQSELPGLSLRSLFENLLHGTQEWSLTELLSQLIQIVLQSTQQQFDLIGQMILLAIIFSLVTQMETSFSNGSIQKVTGLMMQSVAMVLLLKAGADILWYGQDAVMRLAHLMQALLPVQLILMAGLGNIQTAGLLQPSLLLMVQLAVCFFESVLVPLVTMEFLLKMVNGFSDTYNLQRLAVFLRKFILWGITFTTMLFLAILSIQGISGHVLDRLSLRTLKYVTGAAIPVVGGTLSGVLELLLSGAGLIRNAVGFVGLLAILLLTMVPAVKLLAICFLYTFTAAVLQPIGDSKISNLLEQAADTYKLLFSIIALTGVFFFVMILILLAASGMVL